MLFHKICLHSNNVLQNLKPYCMCDITERTGISYGRSTIWFVVFHENSHFIFSAVKKQYQIKKWPTQSSQM
jgi:hypothetical protein